MKNFITYLRKNQKWAMAILGVLCMVTFVATMSYSGSGSSFKNDRVRGRFGNTEVRDSDLALADSELRTLRILFQERLNRKDPTLEELRAESFLLLLREAQQMRVSMSEDDVQAVLQRFRKPPAPEGGGSAPPEIRLTPQQEQALRDLALIYAARQRLGDAPVVSLAMRAHEMEQDNQKVALKLVEFKGAWFTSPSTMPTTATSQPLDPSFAQEMQTQFDQYKDIDPRIDDSGFGYRYPDRVKVQYIELRRDEVKKAILRNGYRMKKEYLSKPEWRERLFPTSEPSTKPNPEVLSGAQTQPLPEERMTTRPYGDKDLQNAIAEYLTTDDMEWIYAEINKIAATDGAAFREAMRAHRAASGPTTESELKLAGPPSSLQVPFNSVEYLERLADRVMEREKTEERAVVRPIIHSEGQFMSADELAALKDPGRDTGIGQTTDSHSFEVYAKGMKQAEAALEMGDIQSAQAIWQMLGSVRRQALSLPVYAIGLAEPIIRDPAKIRDFQAQQRPTLATWQFSGRMVDPKTGDFYTFRLSAASPAHAPASMDEPAPPGQPTIRQRVEADVRIRLGYEEAQRQAKAFLDQAELLGLAPTARMWAPMPATQPIVKLSTRPTTDPSAGLPVVQTGLFSRQSWTIDDYSIPPQDVRHLTTGGFALLDEKIKTGKPQPMKVIDLPRSRTVVVAQLVRVEPLRQNEWGSVPTVAETDSGLRRQLGESWQAQWFSPDSILARMKYQPVGGDAEPKKPANKPQDEPVPMDSPF